MINPLAITDFEPLVGKTLDAYFETSIATPITLLEAVPLGTDADPRRTRDPFSLLFLAPVGAVAPQAIYTVKADGLGPIDIFLVPVGAGASGVRYEAIFG